MFFVFNKRKINSYLISLGTVAILSSISFMSISKNPENTIQTQASVQNEIFEPIFKSETTTNQIALSINCSENAENIERYKAIIAKNKVDKENYVDEYDDIVKSLIDEFSNIMYKISKNPGKYADIWTSVSSMVYSVNSISSWNNGRKASSAGLLTAYSNYVVNKLILSKGDSTYVDFTKSEFENAKKDLDKAIESMERILKSIKDKL